MRLRPLATAFGAVAVASWLLAQGLFQIAPPANGPAPRPAVQHAPPPAVPLIERWAAPGSGCRCAEAANASATNRHMSAASAASPPGLAPAAAMPAFTVGGPPVPILVLKLAASGATWLAGRLQETAGVRFMPEVVTSREAALFSPAQREAFLRAAMRTPGRVGKMRYDRKYAAEVKPTARAAAVLRWMSGRLVGVPAVAYGVSVNPIHLQGVDMANVVLGAEDRPLPRVVLFLRSNVVKHAVAHVHDAMLYEKCGA